MTDKGTPITVDGNEATAIIAHKLSEVIAIYPITPSSPMGEVADALSAAGKKNLWGVVPQVVEMQSEAGAAGAVHGALSAGALSTTFTASQGLLLMIPNMFKIAGELTPTVFHIAARTLAAHALSIFGDHSDVMAARSTGWAMLCSNSVQEAHDLALIAHASTLETRVPFVHFFDGFRTSHEVQKIWQVHDSQIREMISTEAIRAHRQRALSPDHPVLRGSAQNPDVFFQAREAANTYYLAVPGVVRDMMLRFATLTGRRYDLFEYAGAADAERVVVIMGSGAGAVEETVEALRLRGEKVGILKVRLYRPFSAEDFVGVLPPTVRSIAVLDRTKEPGALGEPLYQDVVTALVEQIAAGAARAMPRVIGGRYGLSSKEFTPAMAAGVFEELSKDDARTHFTVGITDDVTNLSVKVDESFSTEADDVVRAVFYGLGSDGTVSANKNSVKIIGENTDMYGQGYFVYDSKKAGAVTVSHLRFSPRPITSSYLIKQAPFVACHQFNFVEKMDVLDVAQPGGTFLLNSPYGAEDVWDHLPVEAQEQIIAKGLRFFVVDAYAVARGANLGARINTVMQTCFFLLSGILPKEQAIDAIKKAIAKTYIKRGQKMVDQNFAAVDGALASLAEVKVPGSVTSVHRRPAPVPADAPDFVQRITAMMLAGKGDLLPVSALPVDGTFPTGTSKWEKRGIAQEIPIWDETICIDCAKCVLICPHAALRMKLFEPGLIDGAPEGFRSKKWKGKDFPDMAMTIQVSPEDCTGCTLCVDVCPAVSKTDPKHRSINMAPKADHLERESRSFEYFLGLPEIDRTKVRADTVKGSQMLQPLFEYSGACSGCGETPYIKLLTQLFGDRILVGNATGCSSIYGGNLPTTPYAQRPDGRGPAWSNSLFEDNAEFALGMRLALDRETDYARVLLGGLASEVGDKLAEMILGTTQNDEATIAEQRIRIAALKEALSVAKSPEARDLILLADSLVRKSVWAVGGDGWAYDIGYGGLDHVLASGRDVNVLVLDTEVYSNTGGQASKSTPRGAVAKFAASGKKTGKKDLGRIATAYGSVYVAQIAMGADMPQAVKAFVEAESYPGPSLIIAYSHCIEHGYDMIAGVQHQKKAVETGYWPLYRYDPRLAEEGKSPLHLDSKAPAGDVASFMGSEPRFAQLRRTNPDAAEAFAGAAQHDVDDRWQLYQVLAKGGETDKTQQPGQ